MVFCLKTIDLIKWQVSENTQQINFKLFLLNNITNKFIIKKKKIGLFKRGIGPFH